MASINNIRIVGLKSFKEHEGMTVYQGNISYNGKKLGFWSQDYYGGCDTYQFNERILDSEVEKYKNSDYVPKKYKSITSLDILLSDLVNLVENEKQYKKFAKKGFPYMVIVTDDYHYWSLAAKADSIEKAKQILNDDIEKAKAQCFKNEEPKVVWYQSLADFNITV